MADVNVNQEQQENNEMPQDMKTNKEGKIVKKHDWKKIVLGTFAAIGGASTLAAVFLGGEKVGEHRNRKKFSTVCKAAEFVAGCTGDDNDETEDDFEEE